MTDNNPYESSTESETPAVNETPASSESSVPPPPAVTPLDVEMNKDARTFAMLCHLLALSQYVIPIGIILGPLVMWLIKKNEFPFVDEQGKEALNFQITMTIAFLICIPLFFIVIGIVLAIAVAILDLVFVIIATVNANDGKHYRYPFALRLIK